MLMQSAHMADQGSEWNTLSPFKNSHRVVWSISLDHCVKPVTSTRMYLKAPVRGGVGWP